MNLVAGHPCVIWPEMCRDGEMRGTLLRVVSSICVCVTLVTPLLCEPVAGSPPDLVEVSNGAFTMGLVDAARDTLLAHGWPLEMLDAERPAHVVHLDGFYIGRTEITNNQFGAFLASIDRDVRARLADLYTNGAITEDDERLISVKSDQGEMPANQATWFGAQAYCESHGLRLPTEAEWEKAARGTDGRTYPWGEQIDRTRANYGRQMTLNLILLSRSSETFVDVHEEDWLDDEDGFLRAAPVGHYPSGASPYGAQDMAGNLSEWVSDWYEEQYYESSPATNPQGPTLSSGKVVRGCAYDCGPDELRVSRRSWHMPDRSDLSIGFRCAGLSIGDVDTQVELGTWGVIKQAKGGSR